MLTLICLLSCKPFPPRAHDYLLATASTGGTFYPVGVGLATLVTEVLQDSPAIRLSAMNSAGSGENVQLLSFREADFAILQGLYGAMAMQGKGPYEGRPQQKAFQAICNLWFNVEHFVIDRDYQQRGDMSDLAELRGHRFSIGKRGSGTETSGRVILQALGYDVEQDFSLEFLGYGSSASAMQDGRLAGMNIPAGVPVAAITQAFATMGADELVVLDFDSLQAARVNETFPLWQRYLIPPGTYPGQVDTIYTLAQPNFLAVHPSLPEEDVYRITQAIFEHLPQLHQTHRAAQQVGLETALQNLPCPLHPGAERYFREKGLIVD